MSTPLLNLDLAESLPSQAEPAQPIAPARPPSPGRGWLREPLLHFVLLGGLLFLADHFFAAKTDEAHTIVVGADVDAEATETFKAARGRAPNPEELEALHRVWLDNEVLYREGLALRVDKGDSAIRERVIFKALSVVDSNVKLPAISDQALRTWFEAHRDKYDEPARFDFEEAALSGTNSEAAVRQFVTALNDGTPGDARAGLRVFKGRPLSNLVDSYGADFAKTLEASTPGTWQALQTRDGWRAIRLNAKTPPKPAVFEIVRGMVRQDWGDATAAEQRTAAVRELSKKYKITFEKPAAGDKPVKSSGE
ncbi:MAG TPA: peptidylprolyl isomerase [Polyangiaceae bacterium]|nr:peptidylprolyl isomerase [Polyangiaceae bacterium]